MNRAIKNIKVNVVISALLFVLLPLLTDADAVGFACLQLGTLERVSH